MPLFDHYHPPLSERRHWESFHGAWASEIMMRLNEGVLPVGYFAEAQVHVGPRVEADVAPMESPEASHPTESGNGVAVAAYTAAKVETMPAVFPDTFTVEVFHEAGGAYLVGAIELVSPGNKDRPDYRRAFAVKCANYLHQGIGLLVIDIVTSRHANLHNVLIDLLQQEAKYRYPGDARLSTVSYRPWRSEAEGERIEMRFVDLALGQVLPVMPLPLRNGPAIPVDLEPSYMRIVRGIRM